MSDRPEDLWLIGLAADVCEGKPVDWLRVHNQATNPEVDAILRGLKRLAGVVDAHRSITEQEAQPEADTDHPKVWRHLALLEVAGSGAFGTVYRAWDARLEREVALKILSAAMDRAPLTEAQHLARVRHPNVVTVYGAEQADDHVGIWMEFIEGETLASAVAQRGPMSAREVAGVGIDMCRALSALHATGLLHRDVKAQNVMREVGGRIVLMDFSGSGALDPRESGPELSGTPLYMAPELLEGRPASTATDTYSVGVLLFYLLSGYLPIGGSSLSDVRRAHREGKRTRLRDLRPELEDTVVQIVERAAHPDPAARYSTAGELESALGGMLGSAPARLPAGPIPVQEETRGRYPALWALAGLALIISGLLIALLFQSSAAVDAESPIRLTIGPPYNTASWPRLSPDGRLVVFGTVADARPMLWLRPLDSIPGHALNGTLALESPFWSPDAKQVAFFADGKLKTIDVDTERIETLTDVGRPRGGSWNKNGVIIFTTDTGIDRIQADGTGRQHVTTLDRNRGEYQHGWPQFLPDGRSFLYVARSNSDEQAGVYLSALGSTTATRLMPAYSRVTYARTGHLLFVRRGTLMAQPFDARAGRLSGEPVPIAGPVKYHSGNDAAFDVSDTGILIYRVDEGLASTRLSLMDRQGRELQPIASDGAFRQPRFSPDKTRVAAEKSEPESAESNIWIYDIEHRSAARLTSTGTDIRPAWSPDGKKIMFSSKRGPYYNVYEKSADGTGPDQLFFESPHDKLVEDWSADGRMLALFVPRQGLWIYDTTSRSYTQIRATTSASSMQAQFSPDSRYIAYAVEGSNVPQVFVEPLPVTGTHWQVSQNGGAEPHWRGDGRELFYMSADGWLMSESIPADRPFTPTTPERLFQVKIPELLGPADSTISNDGTEIVLNSLVADTAVPAIHVVVNWSALLKR
ncbi:MAG TPA: protein kinase [Vicinamibacterales bacterium]